MSVAACKHKVVIGAPLAVDLFCLNKSLCACHHLVVTSCRCHVALTVTLVRCVTFEPSSALGGGGGRNDNNGSRATDRQTEMLIMRAGELPSSLAENRCLEKQRRLEKRASWRQSFTTFTPKFSSVSFISFRSLARRAFQSLARFTNCSQAPLARRNQSRAGDRVKQSKDKQL